MLATVQVLAGEVTPALQRSMAHKGTHADTAVIVRFTNPVDVQALTTGERLDRSEPLLLALKERAARHRAAITPTLQAQGAVKVRDLWLINAVALTVPAVAVKALAALDGVRAYDRDARPVAHIHLPERCANLCFGGRHRNRLFMAASHSLYALYVNTTGA